MRRPVLALALLVALAAAGGVRPAGATNDSLFASQWNVRIVGAESAWARGGTGAGVTIGIVDTGVDLAHEDLAGRIGPTTDCTHQTAGDPAKCTGIGQDDSGHGTHVAGIAVADANNGRGIAGVAPDAKIVVAKVLTLTKDSSGKESATGDLDDVGAGIRWAVQHGARVINLSLGIDDNNVGGQIATLSGNALQRYISEAWNAGAIPVVAAGNNGASSPSTYSGVNAIVVTATTIDDRQAAYASQTSGRLSDAKYAMAAPGGEGDGRCPGSAIVSTYWDHNDPTVHDTYACLAGTSMAAPHVSAAAAILLGLGLTRDQVVARLTSTAKNIGPSSTFGSGRLDLAAATAGLGHEPTATTNPSSTATTRAARVHAASPPRPAVAARGVPTTAVPVTQPPTTTTVTTEQPTTSTSGRRPRLASGPNNDAGGSAKRTAAAALAGAGVLVMGASSTVALRRRRGLRPRH